MFHKAPLFRPSPTLLLGAIISAVVLSGCAQQQQNPSEYYQPQKEGTLTDAQRHAQGKRGSRAPSQLQFGFGEQQLDAPKEQEVAALQAAETQTATRQQARSQARPLRQPRTFLGTLPCEPNTPNCSAMRVTLTIAPTGKWRSRSEPLSENGTPLMPALDQGCWDVVNQNPLRITLESPSSYASFTFVNDNLLKLQAFNNTRPQLDYHLTRQANIDGIEEITNAPALQCN